MLQLLLLLLLTAATRITQNNPANSGVTFAGRPRLTLGGVGRNLAAALGLLGHGPLFLSSLAQDSLGEFALPQLAKTHLSEELGTLRLARNQSSSCFALVLVDSIGGQCQYVVADLGAARAIDPQFLGRHLEAISRAPLLVLDANLQPNSLQCLIKEAAGHQVPVFLEPTDASLQPALMQCLRSAEARHLPLLCMSPNLVELRRMLAHLEPQHPLLAAQADGAHQMSLEQVERLAERLMRVHLPQLRCLLVTMDQRGVLVALRGARSPRLLETSQLMAPGSEPEAHHGGALQVSHFRVPRLVREPVSGAGAGDCLAAGFASGLLAGLDLAGCLERGFRAAELALESEDTVPSSLSSLAAH